MGVLADKLNRKTLLGTGLAVNGLGFVGLGLAPTFTWALAAAVIAGLGGSFYHPSATAMVARLFPSSKGRALGLVGVGASVGFFAGPLYTGWRAQALEAALGAAAWRRPVMELGVLGILGAVLFAWLAQRDEGKGTREESEAQSRERDIRPSTLDPQPSTLDSPLFPTPALWGLFLLSALAFSLRDFAGTSMGSLGSLFLQYAHGFDPKWTGVALSGIFLASVISNPLFGGMSDRGRMGWLSLVLGLAAALVALFPHLPGHLAMVCFVIYGFFFLSSYPMTEAAVMEAVPDAVRGRVFGLFITAGGLIGNLSHWIVGAQVKRLGTGAYAASSYYPMYVCLALLILLSLAGAPCLNGIRKREKGLAQRLESQPE
jgi:MFS family permease